jgi:CHAT domain-containing protein
MAQSLGFGSSFQLDQLEIYLQTGRYTAAIAIANEALKNCLRQRDSECQANALISLAEAERRNGDLSAAETTLRKAAPLVAKEDNFYLYGQLLYAQANQERSSAHFQKAVELYEKVIALVEEIKGRPDSESQRSVGETYDFIYDELIDALYSLREQRSGSEADGYAAEALKYAEANKARQFTYSWGKTFLYAAKQQVPADVQEQERRLLSRREGLEADLQLAISGSDKGAAHDPVAIRKELTVSNENLQAFVDSLRRSYPAYAALKYPESVKLWDIPLRRDETLVETKVTDESTFVWIIRRDQDSGNRLIAFYKVPQKREWFEKRVFSLRDAFNAGAGSYDPHISEELFQALFPGHYETELLQSKTIVFIPDDVLFLVPLELLSPHATNRDFKLLEVPTRYYPSASSLRIARNANHTADWKIAFLGVGDPITSPDDERFALVSLVPTNENKSSKEKVTSADLERGEQFREKVKTRGVSFERLKGTTTELQEIARLFSQENQPVDVRTGVRATKESILETDLTQFRFIHFATHGILPVDTGISEPALVLSLDGTTSEAMFLKESDILGLRIDADAVVLSACETGSGKVSRAEGVMSLGRAFMAAGASSVTVSLWQVSDESTQILMEEYYKNLLEGKPKPEALAIARSRLFAKGVIYKNPFFWAPFILIGE